ncbi:MAG: hypothetical protein ABI342_04040 [Nitrososphaera sp.]
MNDYLKKIKIEIAAKKWIEEFCSSQGYCIICSHSDPLDLEYHHVAGKNNDTLTVSVCRNCHGRLSRYQRYWPNTWTREDNSPDLKQAFFLRGLADILRLVSERIFERHE